MKMRVCDLLANIKSWDFDTKHYEMNKAEAELVIELINEKIEEKKTEDDLK